MKFLSRAENSRVIPCQHVTLSNNHPSFPICSTRPTYTSRDIALCSCAFGKVTPEKVLPDTGDRRRQLLTTTKTIIDGKKEITIGKYHAPTAQAMKSYNDGSIEANKVMGTYVSVHPASWSDSRRAVTCPARALLACSTLRILDTYACHELTILCIVYFSREQRKDARNVIMMQISRTQCNCRTQTGEKLTYTSNRQAVKQLDDGMVGDDFNVFSIPSKEP